MKITTCPHCNVRVAVMSDRNCPSCRRSVTDSPGRTSAIEAKRKPSLNPVLAVAALALMTSGMYLTGPAILGESISLMRLLAGTLITGSGGALLIVARRLRQSRFNQVAGLSDLSNCGTHVLYLRSFEEDRYFNWLQTIHSVLGGIPLYKSPEEHVTEILEELGTVIAIGRPGELLPPVGASRIYIIEGDWQSEVVRLLKDAKLVVIRLGSTEGLKWEIRQLFEIVAPEKILFDIPIKHSHWLECRALIQECCGAQLSQSRPAARFLTFEADWTPVLFRASVGNFILTGSQWFRLALRPIFQRLGARGPKVSVSEIFFHWMLYGLSAVVIAAFIEGGTWMDLENMHILAAVPVMYVATQMAFHWLTH